MSTSQSIAFEESRSRDFSHQIYKINDLNSKIAQERGLVSADWYTTPIPRSRMKMLMQRKDGPAIRDSILWISALLLTGTLGYLTWGTLWTIPALFAYGVLYGSASDSRWHECGHGTAFKTPWMNEVIFHIASFMVIRDPGAWRWSHARHHSDTIIVGRDPEIAVPRPPDLLGIALNFFNLKNGSIELYKILLHSLGKMTEAEKNFVPKEEWEKIRIASRVHILIHCLAFGTALYTKSFLPLMLVTLPSFYGAWLSQLTGLTQHAGLAENVLDHRLNCRTVYMNPVVRFLYWNMNYHVEHHMFPMVPYHALSALHNEMKADTPRPYQGFWEAYCEIVPALIQQVKNPSYYVKRDLPETAHPFILHKTQEVLS